MFEKLLFLFFEPCLPCQLIAKVGKKFRWQILIHGPEGTKIPLPDRSILWKLIPKNVFLTIDVNPAEL